MQMHKYNIFISAPEGKCLKGREKHNTKTNAMAGV